MSTTPSHRPAVVLVTEDEALVRMMAADLLSDEDYRVVEARNADEALEVLDLRPDVRVLFTDVDMPGSFNGFALARIVDRRWPWIGLIVTSGKNPPGPGDLPKKARFISKPYSPSTLLGEVQALLGGTSTPIIVEAQKPREQSGAPILPMALKIDQPPTGNGADGGLAQPVQEPEK